MGSVDKHYARLAERYNELWEYSESFISWMTDEIQSRLAVTPNHRIADVGGGTGIYAGALAGRLHPKSPILCVDPSAEMLSRVPDDSAVSTLCLDAVTFSESDAPVDRIFMKEAIHHIDERQRFFSNIFEKLPQDGVFVLALLPPTVDYPLFQDALHRFENLQPDYRMLHEMLSSTGFSVASTVAAYPLKLPRAQYVEMVRNRYMSLLSAYTDDELEKGIAEISETYRDTEFLRFEDRFAFVVAVKP